MDFILRPWQIEDLNGLVRYANNYKIANNLTNRFPHPYSEEDGRKFIDYVNRPDPRHILSIAIDGQGSGGIGIHPQSDIFCKNAEMGYWLAEPFWGHGIISRAIPQMVAYGFDNWDIDRIFARPFGRNLASQRVLEKAGFTLEARFEKTIFKNGQYEDELVYAIRR